MMVANAVPEHGDRAGALAESMNFGGYYDPNAKALPGAGLIRGGFWLDRRDRQHRRYGDLCGMGTNVQYTGHHYGTFNTEPRIASYVGIAMGQLPPKHYFGGLAHVPRHLRLELAREAAGRLSRTYLGVDVFEGAYRIDDTPRGADAGAAACSRR